MVGRCGAMEHGAHRSGYTIESIDFSKKTALKVGRKV